MGDGPMSDSGMVRPCSCPPGAPATRSTPWLLQHGSGVGFMQRDHVGGRLIGDERGDEPRPAVQRGALLIGEVVVLIDATIPAKLPERWLRTFSMTGSAILSRAMPDATVRRMSCSRQSEIAASSSRRSLALENPLTGLRPVALNTKSIPLRRGGRPRIISMAASLRGTVCFLLFFTRLARQCPEPSSRFDLAPPHSRRPPHAVGR